jgi:ubiquinol-cytochrome c reductase cytochrome b subunit
LLLFGLPFISNRGERSWKRRPWSVAIVLIVVIMIGTLWIAGEQAPWSPHFEAQPLSPEVLPTSDEQVRRGAELFHAEGCIYCHSYAGQGGQRGPNLTNVSERLPPEQIAIAILDGRTNMPSYAGTLKARGSAGACSLPASTKRWLGRGRQQSRSTLILLQY